MDKQHIIDEIRRTASANGGVALGKSRFERETGILESDWFGKHAARWGDLVRDAGVSPNVMKSAFEEEQVLERLANFARELGHFPVNGELVFKHRNDQSFPSHNVFARFGPKADLVRTVRDYCLKREGYDDVAALCEATMLSAPRSASGQAVDEQIGEVYLVKSGRYFKIGRTNALGRREYEIALQMPERLVLVHSIRTDDPVGIEEYWHKRFAPKRRNGEWFDLDSRDLTAFRRRSFM